MMVEGVQVIADPETRVVAHRLIFFTTQPLGHEWNGHLMSAFWNEVWAEKYFYRSMKGTHGRWPTGNAKNLGLLLWMHLGLHVPEYDLQRGAKDYGKRKPFRRSSC